MKTNRTLLVNKQNLSETTQIDLGVTELNEGEALCQIDRYALTANNITYAVCGDSLKYWDFFPAAEPWGIIPVWGYAEIIESKCEGVNTGEQIYGYFPMSEHLVVKPRKINSAGFTDAAAHRQELAQVYNFYTRLSATQNYTENHDQTTDLIPILKPLFATSFLLYDFLKEADFFAAEQIILTSASSKTALALAFLLKQNKAADNKQIIGLTSAANIDFAAGFDYFDEVIAYDEWRSLPKTAALIVDFAGDAALLHRVSQLLGDSVKYISRIGITNWQADKSFANLPNVHGFFAPTHLAAKYRELSPEKASDLINQALTRFIADVGGQIEIVNVNNADELSKSYLNMLSGKINSNEGIIVRVGAN